LKLLTIFTTLTLSLLIDGDRQAVAIVVTNNYSNNTVFVVMNNFKL